MRTKRRVLALTVLSTVLFCFALEVAAFAALHGLYVIRPNLFVHGFVDRHFDAITDDFRRTFIAEGFHDPVLGWDYEPLTEYQFQNTVGEPYAVSFDADGSRSDGLPSKQLLINTYGDSFTWCDEVDNDQTWQYFLESSLGYEVKNFGVGAYGTDQALLKLEGHLARGVSAPITVLGILDENINRVVTSFRPFYENTSVKLGFKPSFRFSPNGQVQLTLNPYDSEELSLDELRGIAHRIAGDDFWVLQSRKIDIHFPYTFQLARTASVIARRRVQDWLNEPGTMNLWETAEGNAVMHYIVDRFVEVTAKSHSLSVVLFIPTGEALRSTDEPKYTAFAREIRARHPELHVVDLMAYEFDRERFNVRPYGGHASAYGNQVIARALEETYRQIQQRHELAPALSHAEQ